MQTKTGLEPKQEKYNGRSQIKALALSGLFLAMIIVSSYIKIPTPLAIPVTLQMPVVILTTLLLGPYLSSLVTGSFLLLGLLGLPIFSGGGGLAYIYKPSFGFIYGFLVAAFLAGHLVPLKRQVSFKKLVLASLVNIAIVYFFGGMHFWLIQNLVLDKATSISMALTSMVFTIFLVKDLVIALLAASLAYRLRGIVANQLA